MTWWTNPWRLRGTGRSLGWGLAAGVALPATVMLVLWAGGAISLQRSTEPIAAVVSAAVSAVVLTALVEEILARYLIFRLLEWRAGAPVALAVTTLLFGLLHFAVASIVDETPAALLHAVPATLTGVLFASAYLLSRSMWLPIALHIGWNLATNAVFGPDVFGAHRLMTVTPLAPGPVSGGAHGTGASLLTSAVLAPLCLALLLAVARRTTAADPRTLHTGTAGALEGGVGRIATGSGEGLVGRIATGGGEGLARREEAGSAKGWVVRDESAKPAGVTCRRALRAEARAGAGAGADEDRTALVRRVAGVGGGSR